MKITVNGRAMVVEAKKLSFDEVVRLAFPRTTLKNYRIMWSVVLRQGANYDHMGGELLPDTSVILHRGTDGMHFQVAMAGL